MQVRVSRKAFALGLCAGALLGMNPRAFAQRAADKQPQRIHISVTKVKPDMVRTFEALVKNEVIPAQKKGGTQARYTWQTALFGESYEYVTAYPIGQMAQYDEPSPLTKALGREQAADLGSRLRNCYESNHSYVVMLRRDLSIESGSSEAPKMATVTTVRVVPGKALEFESFVKSEILPVMKKAGLKDYWAHQTMLGGDPNEYVILSLIPNMAELDRPSPAIRVLGREGWLKLTGKIAGVVASVDTTVSRFVPELSFMPAQ